jgi:flagellar protein FlaI
MFGALDLVVVQGIYSYGNTRIRRCLSIHEISVDRHGAINDVPLYEWNSHDDTFRKVSEHSHVISNIAFTRGWSPEETQKQLQKRIEFLEVSLDVPAPDLADFTNAVHEIGD